MLFDSAQSMVDVGDFINDSYMNEQQNIYDYRLERSLSNSLNAKFQDRDGLSRVGKQRESHILSQRVWNKLLAYRCSNISKIYYFYYIYVTHQCLQATMPVEYAVVQSEINELYADTYAEIDITTVLSCDVCQAVLSQAITI